MRGGGLREKNQNTNIQRERETEEKYKNNSLLGRKLNTLEGETVVFCLKYESQLEDELLYD